jgi:hypothetical protein
MIVRVTDVASTNKFQQDMAARSSAVMSKTTNATSTTNPLNTIDGNSGPAFAFVKLNSSELSSLGAHTLIANRSDQAHLEVIMWTSRMYPAFFEVRITVADDASLPSSGRHSRS